MYDAMDPVVRREYSGARGRRKTSAEQPVPTIFGNGLDKPYVPDPTTDHPLSHRQTSDDDES